MKFLKFLLGLLLLISPIAYTADFDFALKVSMGRAGSVTGIHKFGKAPSGIQDVSTDIWSRADATPTQSVWLAPTAAAYHLIVSTDASDDTTDSTTDTEAARTIIIYGLQTWDTAETSEIIVMNGTTDVTTDAMYVIIHRMEVLTAGSVSINAGDITATAIAPSATTITAVILTGEGQTNMAIYGVPSSKDFYLTRFFAAIDKAQGSVTSADFTIWVNPNPGTQTVNFVNKDHISVQSTGVNAFNMPYKYYPKFSGPCIIKVTAIASADDIDGKASFDGYLVNK